MTSPNEQVIQINRDQIFNLDLSRNISDIHQDLIKSGEFQSDFTQIFVMLINFIKTYEKMLDLEFVSPNHVKIIFDQKIGKQDLFLFIDLYEILTLNRLSIIQNNSINKWICDLYF